MNTSPTTTLHFGWRVPDAVFVVLSWLVVLLTWWMLIYFYPQLPSTIPTHFNWSGVVNAQAMKSWGLFLLPGLLQVGISLLMWWLSRHPDYSHFRSRAAGEFILEPSRQMMKHILSHAIVLTGVLLNLILAYISLGIVRVSLSLTDRLDGTAIFGLIGFLFFMNVVYSIWMMRLTRR